MDSENTGISHNGTELSCKTLSDIAACHNGPLKERIQKVCCKSCSGVWSGILKGPFTITRFLPKVISIRTHAYIFKYMYTYIACMDSDYTGFSHNGTELSCKMLSDIGACHDGPHKERIQKVCCKSCSGT